MTRGASGWADLTTPAHGFPAGRSPPPLLSALLIPNKSQHRQAAKVFPEFSKATRAERTSEAGHPKTRPLFSTHERAIPFLGYIQVAKCKVKAQHSQAQGFTQREYSPRNRQRTPERELHTRRLLKVKSSALSLKSEVTVWCSTEKK